MGSLVTLLHTSLSALQAEQAALDATSNNVANQNTVGYTREVVRFQSIDYVTLNGSIANGVSAGVGAVSQRDRVLEQRVQQQTQAQGQSAALAAALEQIQGIFSLSSTPTQASTTALGAATDSFFSSLTALAANPSDATVRQGVLSAANGLASAFNSAANQLAQIGSSLNQQVTSVVGQVNGLTARIAKLNGEILAKSPRSDAGTLEDQRQAAIGQLSQLIGLNQISTESNGITLTTSDGQVLVGESSSFALRTTLVNGAVHVTSAASGQDITATIQGGQLGGTIAARDTQLPAVAIALDTLANGIALNVNAVNAQGIDGYGSPGQALFAVPAGLAGTAGSIRVTTTDPKLVAAAASGEGSLGNTNAQALAGLAAANIAGGTTAERFYAALLGQVGNATANATADSAQQEASLTQVTTQRDTLSGVSLDEEAANLTKYQRSYQAAAQIFAIVNSLLASAINLGQGSTVG